MRFYTTCSIIIMIAFRFELFRHFELCLKASDNSYNESKTIIYLFEDY